MTNVGEVVTRLQQAVDGINREAVNADGARNEAEQARSSFTEVSQGTSDPRIRAAITESRTAGEKAGKVARLLSEAAEHFATYINVIAPDAAAGNRSVPDVMPDGQRLLSEAADREARLARSHQKVTQLLADQEGDIKSVERLSREAVASFRDRVRPGDGVATVGTPDQRPPDQPLADTSQNPATDLVLAAAAMALATRSGVEKVREFRNRKRSRDHKPETD